ncbi:MAG: YkgJ family cysteine cluster protein [Desulfobacterales bacterium]|nr:YkgJ family cysteine cluster protein [Desulfobacterales bacterium]
MTSDALKPEEVFSCQRCGDCCKGYGGTYLTETDIERICRYLSINREQFLKDVCQLSGGKPLIAQAQNGYCILWDRQCTIHPVKPQMCRRWPFIESILIDAGNWHAMASICPGMRVDVSDDQIHKCIDAVMKKSP